MWTSGTYAHRWGAWSRDPGARHHSDQDNRAEVSLVRQHAPWIEDEAQSPSASGEDSLVLMLGGSAGAIGEDTLVTGTIYSNVKDFGRMTIATGYTEFTAAAESSDGSSVAFADTYADVMGADIVFKLSLDTVGGPRLVDDGSATASSATRVWAIDFEGIDLPGGARVIEVAGHMPSLPLAYASDHHWGHNGGGCGRGHNNDRIVGNLATVTADAVVSGDSGLVATDTFASTALVGENVFSFVSGDAITGIA